MRLTHRLPLVLGAAVLLAGGTGAAALALGGHGPQSPTDSGNQLPIDDNHRGAAPTATPDPAPEPTVDRRDATP